MCGGGKDTGEPGAWIQSFAGDEAGLDEGIGDREVLDADLEVKIAGALGVGDAFLDGVPGGLMNPPFDLTPVPRP